MGSSVATAVLILDAVWFGLGFWFFSLRARRAIRILVPRSAEGETSARALAASLPFLGGMNLGYAGLAVMLLLSRAAAPSWHVYAAFALAHATQWAFNLPHLLKGGRSGGAPWDVARGPMLFIFVMDAVCAVSNLLALLTRGV